MCLLCSPSTKDASLWRILCGAASQHPRPQARWGTQTWARHAECSPLWLKWKAKNSSILKRKCTGVCHNGPSLTSFLHLFEEATFLKDKRPIIGVEGRCVTDRVVCECVSLQSTLSVLFYVKNSFSQHPPHVSGWSPPWVSSLLSTFDRVGCGPDAHCDLWMWGRRCSSIFNNMPASGDHFQPLKWPEQMFFFFLVAAFLWRHTPTPRGTPKQNTLTSVKARVLTLLYIF